MYAETTVIVDGAVDEEEIWHDQTLLDEYLSTQEEEARSHGYPTEVYVMYHDHDFGIECECVQYLTDHRPLMTFNGAS